MQRFFAFGQNKSGTTFLQMLLDAHPRVNCPPEHQLAALSKGLASFVAKYRGILQTVDERTGRQGLRFDEAGVHKELFRRFVEVSMAEGAGAGITHVGLNDNAIGLDLPGYAELFPDTRFICILRDPRAVAVSLYHHRCRTEAEFRAGAMPLERFAINVARDWASHLDGVEAFARRREGDSPITLTRYEDLTGAGKIEELARLYAHLGLEPDLDIARAAHERLDFDTLKMSRPEGFLRAGPKQTWRDELSPATLAELEAKAGPERMARFGYAPSAGAAHAAG